MVYFHVFWSRPQLNPAIPAEEQEIFLWDFEALVWLLSALELRRHSQVQLVTDRRGLRFVEGAGLDWLYSGGISTALDGVPGGIDPQLFWSAGKIVALREMTPPCAWIDLDLVLRHPLDSGRPVTALHWEDRDWPWYQADQSTFANHGFPADAWDWTANPVNTGLLGLVDADLHQLYASQAVDFMIRYSTFRREAGARPDCSPHGSDPTIFAEQRLLAMCAAKLGRPIEVLTDCNVPGLCLPRNPHCLHLWGTKAAYRSCPEARVALVNHLRAEILERFPEAEATLTGWDLAQPRSSTPPDPADSRELMRTHPDSLRFSLLRGVEGLIWIEDPNVGVRRPGREGSMIWSGEIIRPEQGASFDLVLADERSLRITRTTV
jgi:hypothetical protein